MANSTIKFPQEMPPAATINGSDKIMIADAATNEAKSATWDAAKQYLNITGVELKPIAPGPLPAGPAGEVRKMQITEAGTWTFAGAATSPFVNPNNSIMILWWDGSTWSIADQYPMPTIPISDEVTENGGSAMSQKGVFKGTIKPSDLGVVAGTKNLFDPIKVVSEKYIDTATGAVVNAPGTAYKKSGLIPTGPSKVTVSGLSASRYGTGWAFVKPNGAIVKFGNSSQDVASFTADGSGLDSDVLFHFTVVTNKAGDTTDIDSVQVEFGGVATAFDPYSEKVETIKGLELSIREVVTNGSFLKSPVNVEYLMQYGVTTEDFDLVAGKNIFNKLDIESGFINAATGELVANGNYKRSLPIPVKKKGLITISGLGNVHYGLGWRFNKEDGSLALSGGSQEDVTQFTVDCSTLADVATFQFTFKSGKAGDNTDISNIQIEYGGQATSFEPYTPLINGISGYKLNNSGDTSRVVKTEGKKVLFLGDSITTEDSGIINWPTFARMAMGVTDYKNYARSGASFTDWAGHDNVRQQLSAQIEAAITDGFIPDIIVIAIGTNDYQRKNKLGTYDTAISKPGLSDLDKTIVVEAARWAFWKCREQWGGAQCFYGNPLQRAVTPDATELDDNGEWLREPIERMANRYNFKIINAYAESGIIKDFENASSPGRYLTDGLHPNMDGKRKQSAYYANELINRFE